MDEIYRSGKQLYGDSLDHAAICTWFEEEKRGYYSLTEGNMSPYSYGYYALNQEHGFRHIGDQRLGRVLAIGCAQGDELVPIVPKIDEIVALEPAKEWWKAAIGGASAKYVMPDESGKLPLEDRSVDFITCFGVLHHIPNVSFVLRECARVCKPGALFLLREPTHSMGDWRCPRKGLTKNERGIPVPWLERTLCSVGFEVVQSRSCMFPLLSHIAKLVGVSAPYNSNLIVKIDAFLSWVTAWNNHYHRDSIWKKFAPSSKYYVLRRRR